nr:allatostatin-CC [Carausius morosus]
MTARGDQRRLCSATSWTAMAACWLWLALLLAVCVDARDKRRANTAGEPDYPDYQSGVRYDEYPVVVPKRTAMLLDKIIVALQKAVDEDTASELAERPDLPDSTMDLQRRGQQKGRVYWRCYFNAVTCFKRK